MILYVLRVLCVFAEVVYVCVTCACFVCNALSDVVWYVVCGCFCVALNVCGDCEDVVV